MVTQSQCISLTASPIHRQVDRVRSACINSEHSAGRNGPRRRRAVATGVTRYLVASEWRHGQHEAISRERFRTRSAIARFIGKGVRLPGTVRRAVESHLPAMTKSHGARAPQGTEAPLDPRLTRDGAERASSNGLKPPDRRAFDQRPSQPRGPRPCPLHRPRRLARYHPYLYHRRRRARRCGADRLRFAPTTFEMNFRKSWLRRIALANVETGADAGGFDTSSSPQPPGNDRQPRRSRPPMTAAPIKRVSQRLTLRLPPCR